MLMLEHKLTYNMQEVINESSDKKLVSHKQLSDIARLILQERFGINNLSELTKSGKRNFNGGSVDMYNDEIGVEIGVLRLDTMRLVRALQKFKYIYWFPYPKIEIIHDVPIMAWHIFIIERTQQDLESLLVEKDKKIDELEKKMKEIDELKKKIKDMEELKLSIGYINRKLKSMKE